MAAVEQLFSYGPDVRRVMYTTNAVESVNASFRKAVRRGCFPDDYCGPIATAFHA